MMTADSLQLTAYGMRKRRPQGSSEPLAVSRKPIADVDCPLTEAATADGSQSGAPEARAI